MKNLVKLKVILIAFVIFITSSSYAAERILPKAKPSVDQEVKAKTAKKKEIYPKKKPETKIKSDDVDTNQEVVKSQETKEEYAKERKALSVTTVGYCAMEVNLSLSTF